MNCDKKHDPECECECGKGIGLNQTPITFGRNCSHGCEFLWYTQWSKIIMPVLGVVGIAGECMEYWPLYHGFIGSID